MYSSVSIAHLVILDTIWESVKDSARVLIVNRQYHSIICMILSFHIYFKNHSIHTYICISLVFLIFGKKTFPARMIYFQENNFAFPNKSRWKKINSIVNWFVCFFDFLKFYVKNELSVVIMGSFLKKNDAMKSVSTILKFDGDM